MGAPQIAMVALLALQIGMNLAKHGEPRTGHWNFYYALIAVGIETWILIAGDFFA